MAFSSRRGAASTLALRRCTASACAPGMLQATATPRDSLRIQAPPEGREAVLKGATTSAVTVEALWGA